MKIVKTGNTYDLFGDDLIVQDTLRPSYYTVCYHEKKGFWLEDHSSITINENKIYGVHPEKIKKVLDTYRQFSRNLGIILSGNKGIGKSLFAKILSIEAVKESIPVIIVDRYYPGIAGFLESIEQEVMILFDEFDKTFSVKVSENNADAQASMLTLFDGIAQGKKLFVVTCNDLRNMNDYLVNRPGRFHYHFRFDYPSNQEIEEYLKDKIDEAYYDQISAVQEFASKVPLNFDCLRAIAYELNTGLPFNEAILDLNIVNVQREAYIAELHFKDGEVIKETESLDLFGEDVFIRFDYEYDVNIDLTKSTFDYAHGVYFIPADGVKIDLDRDDYSSDEKFEKDKEKIKGAYVVIKRKPDKRLHYAV